MDGMTHKQALLAAMLGMSEILMNTNRQTVEQTNRIGMLLGIIGYGGGLKAELEPTGDYSVILDRVLTELEAMYAH